MRAGTLCIVEPTNPAEPPAGEVAGLVVVTRHIVVDQTGRPFWRLSPSVFVSSWMCEIAIHESWLRPLDGERCTRAIPAEAFAHG
jgi:hypothetical protein